MKLNEITIEVTQRCPNRCIYCSSLSDMEKAEALSFETICKLVEDAKTLGAKSVNLSGGEPFLREDIVEIVNYIQNNRMKIRLYSSGVYNDGHKFASVPHTLLESIKEKVDALIFNYETIDPALYATIMGTQTENLALLDETIEDAIALGIPVEAHLVPMHCNFKQIPAVLSKLYSMGVPNVSILRLVPQGRVMENSDLVELSSEDLNDMKQILVNCLENYKGKIRLGLPFSAKYAICGTGSTKLTVRYDGYVFPCEAFKDGMMEIKGNVIPENVKDRDLKDIYENSAYLRQVREGIMAYSKQNNIECCYGQFCRHEKQNKSN